MIAKLKTLLPLTLSFVLGIALNSAHALTTINVTTAASSGDCIPGGDPCTDFNGTDCELQDALDIASCDGDDDVINVTAGLYDSSTINGYSYQAIDGENFDLSIIGVGPTSIIDGNNLSQGLSIDTNVGPDDQAAVLLSNLSFQNGESAGPGGAVSIITSDADVTVQDCEFLQNHAQLEFGGGLSVECGDGSIVVDHNNFIQNNTQEDPTDPTSFADDGGGASLTSIGGTISLNGNLFQLNTGASGGGLFVETNFDSSNPVIIAVNNIFDQNTALGEGGGISAVAGNGSIVLTNNTLFNNSANEQFEGSGGGIAAETDLDTRFINIYNNIVFGNSATVSGADIWTCEQGATVNLFNNDFTTYFSESRDGGGCGGPGATINEGSNIPDDPQFVNSGTGDFHLLAGSPAIDTGELNPPDGLPTPDFDGVTRPQGPLPDMGALEFQAIPTPTPTPTPTPSPTPVGIPLDLSGDGALSCAFQSGAVSSQGLTAFLAGTSVILGCFVALRRKIK